MDVLIQDSDVISLILEYLQSRKLHASAVCLENESGILSKRDGNLPEDILFLRQLTLKGNWETLISYLEPFTNLEEFNSSKMYYVILCQQFYETLHEAVNDPVKDNKNKLKQMLNAIKPYCSQSQFDNLCQAKSQSNRHDFNLPSSRMHCFNDLIKLLAPLYEDNDFITQTPNYQNNSLVSAITHALFYTKCVQQCVVRGQDSISNYHHQNAQVSSESLFNNKVPSASLFYWLKSINSSLIFKETFTEGTTRIKCKPLQTHRSPRPCKTSDNFTNGSFANDASIHLYTDRSTTSSLSSTTNQSFSPSRHNANNNNNSQIYKSANGESLDTDQENINIEKTQITSSQNLPKHKGIPIKSGPRFLDETHFVESTNKTTPTAEENILSQTATVNSEIPHPNDTVVKFEKSAEFVSKNSENFQRESNPPSVNDNQANQMTAKVIDPEINVNDSYAEFLREKELLRKQKDYLLQNIENKTKLREEIQNTILKEIPVQPKETLKNETTSESKYVHLETMHDACAIRAVSFHPSGMVYAVGSNSKTLRICAVQQSIINGKQVEIDSEYTPTSTHVLNEIQKAHKGTIYCVDWNQDGNLLLSGSNDKMVKIHNYDVLSHAFTSHPSQLSFHRGIIRDAVFLNGHNAVFASGGGDATVYITDGIQQKTVHELHGHTDQILSMYSWGVNTMASASQDKTVRIWDLRSPRCSSIIGVSSSEANLPLSVCANYDGSVLATGHENGWISIYDMIAGKLVLRQETNTGEIRTVRFNTFAKNNVLLSGSYGGEMVLTYVNEKSINDGECKSIIAAKIKDKIIQCRWHPNGRDFAATSAGNICNYYYKYE